jgi:hypothetical protein
MSKIERMVDEILLPLVLGSTIIMAIVMFLASTIGVLYLLYYGITGDGL